jgi:hypothetical protein
LIEGKLCVNGLFSFTRHLRRGVCVNEWDAYSKSPFTLECVNGLFPFTRPSRTITHSRSPQEAGTSRTRIDKLDSGGTEP